MLINIFKTKKLKCASAINALNSQIHYFEDFKYLHANSCAHNLFTNSTVHTISVMCCGTELIRATKRKGVHKQGETEENVISCALDVHTCCTDAVMWKLPSIYAAEQMQI